MSTDSSADRRRVAYHEAGHAVVAVALGLEIQQIAIHSDDHGTTWTRLTGGRGCDAAIYWAGYAAEQLWQVALPWGSETTTWKEDCQGLTRAVLRDHLPPSLTSVDCWNPGEYELVQQCLRRCFRRIFRAKQRAYHILSRPKHRAAVERLADALTQCAHLPGARAEELIRGAQ